MWARIGEVPVPIQHRPNMNADGTVPLPEDSDVQWMKVINTIKDGVWDMAGVQEQLDAEPGYRFLYLKELDDLADSGKLQNMALDLATETGLTEVALIGGSISASGPSERYKQLDKALAIEKKY